MAKLAGLVAIAVFSTVLLTTGQAPPASAATGLWNIDTVAGTGQAGFSGDGGPAASAQLKYPAGASADSAGNVYIADSDNNRIRKVDTSGIITTAAGIGRYRLWRGRVQR